MFLEMRDLKDEIRAYEKMRTPRVEAEFAGLVQRWRLETRHWSSMKRSVFHPAYQRIIGMGPAVLPLLLKELRDRPDHWFWALTSIAGEDPAAGTNTLDEAVAAWMEWGKRNGLLAD